MTNHTKTYKDYRREEEQRGTEQMIAALYSLLLIIGAILWAGLQTV